MLHQDMVVLLVVDNVVRKVVSARKHGNRAAGLADNHQDQASIVDPAKGLVGGKQVVLDQELDQGSSVCSVVVGAVVDEVGYVCAIRRLFSHHDLWLLTIKGQLVSVKESRCNVLQKVEQRKSGKEDAKLRNVRVAQNGKHDACAADHA